MYFFYGNMIVAKFPGQFSSGDFLVRLLYINKNENQ